MSTALVPVQPRRDSAGRFIESGRALERGYARAIDHALPAYLTDSEVHAVIGAAENDRDRMLLTTLWATGGRASEVLALRRGDFDPQGLCVRLANLKQRRGAEKIVYVSQGFALALLAYCDARRLVGPALLFPSRTGKPLDRHQLYRIVRDCAERAGVRAHGNGATVHPHTFRHSNAVHLLRSGVPLPAVQSQLGHASILTTMVYTKLAEDDKRRMISGVEF